MRRTWVLAALLAACGDVKGRGDCATSAACPAGEYCAQTKDGGVCWPDAVPPTLGAVTVACDPVECPRDGALVVTAQAADDAELASVEAALDFAPGRTFPLARGTGAAWSGRVALAAVDFPALFRAVAVTVTATDGARNAVSAVATERPVVTRVRWAYASSGQLTPPSVMPDGTVLFGRSDTLNQLVAVRPDGTKAWSLSVGSGTVTSPPSVGSQAIWVGANDGKLYAVKLDGSAELTTRTCTASGVAKGPPAVLTTSGVDVAFGAFSNGRIYASGPSCVPTAATDAPGAGPAIGTSGAVFETTSAALTASLRSFSWDGQAFASSWATVVGGEVTAPIAFQSGGAAVTGGKDHKISTTTLAGTTSTLATLAGSIDESPIVLGDGDVVVGDASGKLHRIGSDGGERAGWPVELGAAVHAPMALTGGPVRFLAATADGKVHALADGGAVLWSGPLTAGLALGAGNLHTPAGSELSTAYFAGADGRLYAVIVEGRLDTSAPWPKAWHDARNTSRAGGSF